MTESPASPGGPSGPGSEEPHRGRHATVTRHAASPLDWASGRCQQEGKQEQNPSAPQGHLFYCDISYSNSGAQVPALPRELAKHHCRCLALGLLLRSHHSGTCRLHGGGDSCSAENQLGPQKRTGWEVPCDYSNVTQKVAGLPLRWKRH